MSPILAASLGALISLLFGGLGVALWSYGRRSRERIIQASRPLVDEQVVAVLDSLRQPAMLLGPYDEVLHSTPAARTTGMARGSRVTMNELLDPIRDCRSSSRPASHELHLKRSVDSPGRDFGLRLTPLPRGVVFLVAEDRSAIARIDETKRDLVANISHELKTPVGALQVLAEAVTEAAEDPEAVQHFAQRMREESARLGELVAQIIDLSRLQSDDPLLRDEVVEIDEVVDSAIGRCAELADQQKVSISVAGERGLRVVGDSAQLTTALVNLVQNAIAYSDSGARVAVSTHLGRDEGDHTVEIIVADNGIGIAAVDLDRIFERFYRVDYARSRASGGTGLGLSIVKHTVAAHGGSVDVWSKVGQGSTFTIRLPALLDARSATGPSAPAVPVPSAGSTAESPRSAKKAVAQRSTT